MGKLGIFNPDQEKKLSIIVDDAIKAKGLLELIDGYAAQVLISQLDDRVIEKINIPESIKSDLGELIDAGIAENVDQCEEIAANIINGLVDIPGLDEQSEGLIFKGVVEMIVGFILKKVRG